ncbi:ribonuclease E activity regulator RraA [Amantichitinum ursilacus]|uniref:4-hydroxy-4-methyl-2-oxoglutarate aldolase n=1 Tax=Amantichitinum ursilacus TaxID=857265 RepID=A0A0N0XIK2_9NEIS|nr:ribonuclease E activity regulator RraA [Amantichitinum ursilacus]KPC52780.1 putative regulator of ribonuclease activity [Amantichitinum ursilacus]
MPIATADLIDAVPDAPSCDTQFVHYGRKLKMEGRIRTVRVSGDNALVKQTLATPGAGAILVVDGGGSLHSALVGDLIATSALENGWGGLVIYGAVRDTAILQTLYFGIKALGSNPRKSAKSGAGDVDVPVGFGGITFTPGHYLYSDEDGIVVLPEPLEI